MLGNEVCFKQMSNGDLWAGLCLVLHLTKSDTEVSIPLNPVLLCGPWENETVALSTGAAWSTAGRKQRD